VRDSVSLLSTVVVIVVVVVVVLLMADVKEDNYCVTRIII